MEQCGLLSTAAAVCASHPGFLIFELRLHDEAAWFLSWGTDTCFLTKAAGMPYFTD